MQTTRNRLLWIMMVGAGSLAAQDDCKLVLDATIKAFEFINRRVADANVSTLYLDLACGTTKVWITHGSALVFAKVILMGGHDLARDSLRHTVSEGGITVVQKAKDTLLTRARNF